MTERVLPGRPLGSDKLEYVGVYDRGGACVEVYTRVIGNGQFWRRR
jgi:hypothetical protein